jgi:hypothetical protein
MNTHLSEASVNSLLSLVKGANTSGSYDDKINILTKAGILQGGQTYSSRAVTDPVPDYTVMVPVQGDAANWLARVMRDYDNLENLTLIANAARPQFASAPGVFEAGLNAIAAGKSSIDVTPLYAAFAQSASTLDLNAGSRMFTAALEQAVRTGLVCELARLKTYQSDLLADPEFLDEIAVLFLGLGELGLRIGEIIKQGSAYLSTIPDGKYNFRVFPANTAQPVILTGTAVITSQYDQYSSILLQKLINNTIVGTPPITALQTLDISYNSRQVDTTGSSSTGKYTVVGNTATITSNGYSKAVGAFVETVTTIISSIFSVYVINSIINPDKSQTTISLTIYTRQLTSAEVIKAIDDAFTEADTDGDGVLSRDEAVKAAYRLAASLGDRVILNLEQFDQLGRVPINRDEFRAVFRHTGSYEVFQLPIRKGLINNPRK